MNYNVFPLFAKTQVTHKKQKVGFSKFCLAFFLAQTT